MADGVPLGRVDEQVARRLWWAALDTLQDQILMPMDLKKGLWLASPLPALYESRLLERLQGWVWVPEELPLFNTSKTALFLPASVRSINNQNIENISRIRRLPLREEDGFDPLLIIITKKSKLLLLCKVIQVKEICL